MASDSSSILKRHSLRVTSVRSDVLNFFTDTAIALSHADLENRFSGNYDRVTIYRTLGTFLDSGLLHKIPDDSGSAKYALCHEACDTHRHFDDHVHFKCTICNNINCLHDLHIPPVMLPEGYTASAANLLLEGICPACSR